MKQFRDQYEASVMLSAKNLVDILGLSKEGVYQLMHRSDFPTLRIGKRMLVPDDKFNEWIEQNLGQHILL